MITKIFHLGHINTLRIARSSDYGFFLANDSKEEVLLPDAYVTDEMHIGDEIDVFIYTDSEDRYVATTETPKGHTGDFVCLEVVDVAPFGAFLDWGLKKDLFLPKNMQFSPAHVGEKKVIRIVEDKVTHRLLAVERFHSFLDEDVASLEKNQEVDIIAYDETPLGFKVIIDNRFDGLIYANEIFEPFEIGTRKKAYIKQIREDGKIDVSLQVIGAERNDVAQQKVLAILKENETMPFTSKSGAKDIYAAFGLSKKSFKKALTKLKEQGVIEADDHAITLKK